MLGWVGLTRSGLEKISLYFCKGYLNCLWTHWRDLVINAADSHIPHVMTTTGKNDYIPRDLRNIQKCIKSTNAILKQFKRCFIE